jgi:hypothetical protein
LLGVAHFVFLRLNYRSDKEDSHQMSEARVQEGPEYKPGTFCWVESVTNNAAAAKTFYTQLFGWDYADDPIGPK